MLMLQLWVVELIHETELLKFPIWPTDYWFKYEFEEKQKILLLLKVFIRHSSFFLW